MTDTLKSICEQCVHLLNPQLDFIPEKPERHREIILRDIKELVSIAFLGHAKSVVILSGCIFESILVCFIQSQIGYITLRRGAPFTLSREHNLGNYVNIFNRYFSTLFSIPDIVVGYRDMVHINQELKYPPEVCQRAAGEMLRLLNQLLEKLSEYVQP